MTGKHGLMKKSNEKEMTCKEPGRYIVDRRQYRKTGKTQITVSLN